MDSAQVAARIRIEKFLGSLRVLATEENRTEHPSDALVPGQLAKCIRVRQRQQFRGVRRKADEVSFLVCKYVGDAAYPGLHTAAGQALPMLGWHRLAHDAPGDRDILVVNGVDSEFVDLFPDLRDQGFARRIVQVVL